MKIATTIAELSRALYRVQGITDKKTSTPIYSHVLLSAKASGKLQVSATDSEIGITGDYQVEVSEPGDVAVDAKRAYEIIKSLPESAVTLETALEGQRLEIKSAQSHVNLVYLDGQEFPPLPQPQQIETFTLPTAPFLQMIERTLFCVSTDENRANLNGIFCETFKKNSLRMVSTDGHRLAVAEETFEQPIKLRQSMIIPRKSLQELRRIVGDHSESPENLEMGFSTTTGLFRAGTVTLTTRLVEGQFPDYQQVIPKGGQKVAKLNRKAFLDALRRVSLLSQGRAYGVALKFSENHLQLVAEDPEYGQATEDLVIDFHETPATVGFNARYIMDVLNLVRDDGVIFELTDELSPGILKPLEESGFLAVVMPMRI